MAHQQAEYSQHWNFAALSAQYRSSTAFGVYQHSVICILTNNIHNVSETHSNVRTGPTRCLEPSPLEKNLAQSDRDS